MAGEKRPRPVASPLRVSAFGADRKAACAKVAKKVAKVVKAVKPLKGPVKGPVKSVKVPVKVVIRRRVERTAPNDTVRKALELYETL